MNEFDQYVKHGLKQKYYIRYADDFTIIHSDRAVLLEMLPKVNEFLSKNLKLTLHPHKVSIKTVSSGIDFLGWVHFPDHRVLRTATKKRMLKKLGKSQKPAIAASYFGMLKHGNAHTLRLMIEFSYAF